MQGCLLWEGIGLGPQGSISGLWSDTLALVSLLLFSDFCSSNHPSFDLLWVFFFPFFFFQFFFPPGGSRERRGLSRLI